jgi:transcriptional regulator with XRE-family HTH domain
MSLATTLKRLRVQKGETLQQVADAVGASKPHVWELEAERAKNPSLDLLTRLAKHYGVTVSLLIGEEKASEAEAMVFGRDFSQASEEDKALILQMADRIVGQKTNG